MGDGGALLQDAAHPGTGLSVQDIQGADRTGKMTSVGLPWNGEVWEYDPARPSLGQYQPYQVKLSFP